MAGSDARRGTPAPPVFGRADVLAEIDHALDHTREGNGAALLLSGDDGSGKSLLVRAALARARSLGFRALSGRALPEEIPQPFSVVRELLRSMGTAPLADRPARSSDADLPIFLAPYATDVDRDEVGVGREEATPRSGAVPELFAPLDSPADWIDSTRGELFAQLTQYLADLAEDAPVLIAIDDLHFADPSSLEFIGGFASKLGGRRIAVIATLAVGSRIPTRAREPLESLARSSSVRTVRVPPLSANEVGDFARWLRRGLAADPADVLRWHAQTEGNPLFVEQLVRSTAGLEARPTEPGRAAADLHEILLARVRRLADPEQRTLTYASILGREFDLPTLVAVSEMSEERLTEALDRLVQEGLLRERGDEAIEFVTESVRASVYAELTETRRRLLHRRIGRILETKHLASDFELARQFYLGRDDGPASEYNARAARAAMRAFAFETAVPHLERALEAERRRPDRSSAREIQLLNELGRALDELGDFHRSEVVLSEAVTLARTRPELDGELGRALLHLAQTRQDQSEFASAEALAREAFSRLERAGAPREVMTSHRVLGVVYWRLGRLSEAETHLRLALDIAEKEGTSIERGHALVDVANAMIQGGEARFSQALALYEEAAALFGSGLDLSAQARVLMNRAVLLYSSGHPDEALEGLRTATEVAERSKSPVWIGYCYVNIAQIQSEQGRPDQARPALERATAILIPLGDRLGSEQIALANGLLAEAEKDFDAARHHFEDAQRQAEELKAEPEVCEMLFRLAHLAHVRGDDESARRTLDAARAQGLEQQRPDLALRVAALEAALQRPTSGDR